MKKLFCFQVMVFMAILVFDSYGYSQNNSTMQISQPVISYLVPYDPPIIPDTASVIKPNFDQRDLQEFYVNPTHYPDLVWQQTELYDPNRAASATLLWDVQGIGTNLSPPDPSGDADSLVYIQGTNSGTGGTYRIVNKLTGATILASATMTSLGGPTGLGDPIILYDKAAKRWIITEFAQTGNRLIIHVSQTSNPQGAYY